MKNTKRNCKLCKTPFRGRSDKIFCSLACKNEYHVRLRQVTAIAVKDTDKILHRNRSILLELMGKNKTKKKLPKILLDRKKFNFHHMTGVYINKNQKIYRIVYDFAWMDFTDGEILIIRRSFPKENPKNKKVQE